MTALKLGLQDPQSDVSSAALLALGETCAVLEVIDCLMINLSCRVMLFIG